MRTDAHVVPLSSRRWAPSVAPTDLHRTTLDSLGVQVAVLDGDGTIITANRAWEQVAGPELSGLRSQLSAMLAGEIDAFTTQVRSDDEDGERWFSLRATTYDGPGLARVVVQREDVTARVRAEREATVQAGLLDDIDAAVIATDLAGTVTHWSRGAFELYGWSSAEAVGRRINDLVLVAEAGHVRKDLMERLLEQGSSRGERLLRRKDGSDFVGYVSSAVHRDADGAPAGFIGVSVDITEEATRQSELRHARDYLRAVTDSMGEALCTLDGDGCVSYMNAAAEWLLGWSSDELRGQPLLHATPDVPFARVEDTTFVRRDGGRLPVSYTSSRFETADGSRGTVVVFSDITKIKAEHERLQGEIELLSMERTIQDALKEERFVLYAQPIIDLATGVTVSHELLVRMRERDGTIVAPGMFLPTAERCGLIRDIDRWVVGQAEVLVAQGHAIELNLSAASLGDDDLYEDLVALLAARVTPDDMVVEVTETALMQDEDIAATFIERMAALGCKFALDDFGTGFGGFSYLKRLPVDFLKIDVEFVRDIATNVASRHVVDAVVGLARAFGQKTVAEGVEDDETLRIVKALGVDYGQGYGIGRPAPLEQTIYA
jgi:PAS domain S-box-containing protein